MRVEPTARGSETQAGTKILVVEDDPEIGGHLVRGLSEAGFQVELETRGDLANDRVREWAPALIVLDINLPGKDGFELLEGWRSRLSTPIVVLTARVGLEDRLQAFAKGAVDFLPKPFFIEELRARIEARLGRPSEGETDTTHWANVTLDLAARLLTKDGEDVGLTPHELNVLAYLVERPGRALSRSQLAEHALSMDGETSDRTIDSHIARVRKKLGPPAAAAIKTVWGIGYRFDGRG